MWKMDKTNAGWSQGLGLWYDPVGEGVSLGRGTEGTEPLGVKKEGESSGQGLY